MGTYGIESIESLAVFYGSNCILPNNTYPPIVDSENLKHQFKVFKTFVIKHRLEWENTQSQLLLTAQQKLSGYKTELDTLDSLLSKRKKLVLRKKMKQLEKEVGILKKNQKYTFEVMLLAWMGNSAAVRHPDMTRLIEIAALIPPSTAEVERSFSLMKLVSTRLRNRMNQETACGSANFTKNWMKHTTRKYCSIGLKLKIQKVGSEELRVVSDLTF